jgi:hypothetical protein
VRRDVADIALADFVFAPHYAAARHHSVIAPSAFLRTAPNESAPAGSQLLLGEEFHVLDQAGGWAWGYCGHDHYVGYVRFDSLGEPVLPTHIVSVGSALLFEGPDIKSRAVETLSLGARVQGVMEGDFLATASGRIHHRHVAPIDARLDDIVETATRFLGAPYLWGGRGDGGVDCSGLVQLAVSLAGHECPRDSDQQRHALGRLLEADEPAARGDLVFFPGHVGFMADETRLLHANAWWMAVTIEPLTDVVGRLSPSHAQPILARRRIASS